MKNLFLLFNLAVFSSIAMAQQNPFAEIGKKAEVLSLSDGLYDEMPNNNKIQRIGSVMINMETEEIIAFVPPDTTKRRPDPTIFSRWYSPDPLDNKYPGISPYNFSMNSPLIFDDPDGQDGRLTVTYNPKGAKIIYESTVYLYGANAGPSEVSDLNKAAAKLSKPRSFEVDGKVYEVTVKVTFKRAPAIDKEINDQTDPERGITSIPNASKLSEATKQSIGFKEGDNILELDATNRLEITEGAAGVSTQGGNGGIIGIRGFSPDGFLRASDAVHEVFHFLGFDERYFPQDYSDPHRKNTTHNDMHDDVLGNQDGKELHPVHYIDIIKFAKTIANGSNIKGQAVKDPKVDNTNSGNTSTSNEDVDKAKKAEKVTPKK